MNIPHKAIAAAARVAYEDATRLDEDAPKWDDAFVWVKSEYLVAAANQLKAAAPYLRAQAVRDESAWWLSLEGHEVYTNEDVGNVLEYRADELDPR